MRVLALLVLCSCSVVVSPDPGLLGGGGFDGGPVLDAARVDAGPGVDSGPPIDAGMDSATPPRDAGPGCGDRPPRCEENNYVTCVEGRDVSAPCGDEAVCDVAFGGCRGIFECPGAPDMCRDNTSYRCVGGNTYTAFPCDGGCDATTGLCNEGGFVPSNLGADAFRRDADDVMLPGGEPFRLNTDACMVTRGTSGVRAMNNGNMACVWQVHDLQTTESSYLRVLGSLPLIIIASGDVSLLGTFELSAEGAQPGPGGFLGGSRGQPDGQGDSGGRAGMNEAPFGDGGGGGGGGLTNGGRGGNADDAQGGDGGEATPNSGEPLVGGSGGGVGPGFMGREGNGGAGGGALQVSALGTLNFQGTIHASGGGGAGGTSENTMSNWGAGGGGGAGGTILLEAVRVEMQGHVSVSGGGGGAGPTRTYNGGRDGEDGPIDGTASGGGAGNNGGDGGGEVPEDGDSTGSDTGNGGGGGGSAGTVILRGENIVVGGSVNPDVPPARLAL